MANPQPRPPVPEACPHGARWVALTKGALALVDADDYERVTTRTWCVDQRLRTSYAVSGCSGPNRRRVLLHQFVLGVSGRCAVDHRNGDGLDNRKENLRLATSHQNAGNARKRKMGTSRFKGVGWSKDKNCWRARILLHGKHERFLGYFDNEQDAAAAYDRAAVVHFGEFAMTNKEGACAIL